VRGERFTSGAVLALVLAAGVALVATSIGSARPRANFKMAIVTDGSLQDRSFNQLANEGRIAIGKELGVSTRVYETKADSERVPNNLAASRAGYNLVVDVGFLNYGAINAVAPRFPKLQFAGIDIAYGLLSKKPKNATGVIFAEQDAGFLVGYLAGLQVEQQGGKQVISVVGANNVPSIVHYMSGYIQGAKRANPGIKVLANYANDPTFSDQAKCKETALGQIHKGSQAILQVAGGCGLGALSAARDAHVWGIGSDADQLYLGPHMMTSALKFVNVAVEEIIRLAYAGNLKTGGDYVYSLKNNGVGLGSVSPKISKAFVVRTKVIATLIGEGKIVVKPVVEF